MAIIVVSLGLVAIAAALWAMARAGADRVALGVAGAAGVAAFAAYLVIGSPGSPGRPFSDRAAELAVRQPSDLTPAEQLARLEALTRERPEDAAPHFFIGQLLAAQGRDADAVRAYQSALRRDQAYAPALAGMADAMTRLNGGDIDAQAAALYAAAFDADASATRAGFLAGMALWRSGARDQAESLWSDVLASLPEGDPERARLSAALDAARRAIPPQPETP